MPYLSTNGARPGKFVARGQQSPPSRVRYHPEVTMTRKLFRRYAALLLAVLTAVLFALR